MTDEQLKKLPKYARDEIARLNLRLSEAIERIEEGNKPTPVYSDPHSDHPRYLPADRQVRFQVGEDWQEYIDVTLRTERGRKFGDYSERLCLEVRTALGLTVRPNSSNVLTLLVEQR